jgi:D-tyrosyl-tRNA(Tyr) deacylase
MRAVIQRCRDASVSVDGRIVGQIAWGLVALVGVEQGDTLADAEYVADKTAELRIFPDDAGKMNRSVVEIGGEVLAISQFTLLGDARKGRRPSFTLAADPALGENLYAQYVARLQARGLLVATGQFRADMQVALINDGPSRFCSIVESCFSLM